MRKKLISKMIWVLNNFLTMECYRKLCNRLYWKKLSPGTASYKTRLWIIMFGVLSAVWLAFFFDPTDPTSSISFSLMIALLAKTFTKMDFSIHSLLRIIEKAQFRLKSFKSYQVLNSENMFLWRSHETYFRTSALLI